MIISVLLIFTMEALLTPDRGLGDVTKVLLAI